MNCPKCNSAMRSLAPKRSAKAPDFVCDMQGCGDTVKGTWRATAVWLDRGTQPNAAPTPAVASSNGSGGRWTWAQLNDTYEHALRIAAHHIPAMAVAAKLPVPTVAEILQGTATVFIAATQGGIKSAAPKPAPQQPPPPPPPPASGPVYADGPAQEGDDDLPF